MIDYIGRIVSSVSTAFEINHATLSGCIDVVVIEQEDGTMMCTPFHVRFGKLKVLKSKEKAVTIQVNGEEAQFQMKLGAAGDGYFEEKRRPRTEDDFMSDDQSDPENYMSSEDDSELNSPRKEGEQSSPSIEPEDKQKKDKDGKKKKKWGWLWKSAPDDAVQVEKEKEEEMRSALEKFVKNEYKEFQRENESERENGRGEGGEGEEEEVREVIRELEGKKEPEPEEDEKDKKQEKKEDEKEKEKTEIKEVKETENGKKTEETSSLEQLEQIIAEEPQILQQALPTLPLSVVGLAEKVLDESRQDIAEEKEKELGKEEQKDKEKEKEKEQKLEKSNEKEANGKVSRKDSDDNQKHLKKSDKKKGILKSFFGMFGSEKEEKEQKDAEKSLSTSQNIPPSSGFHASIKTTNGAQEPKKEAEESMSFQDEIENVDFSLDDDTEKTTKSKTKEPDFPPDADIELSLCANEIEGKENEDLTAIFLRHRIPFSKFIKDPLRMLMNPNLMVKIDDKLYDWKLACPLIISLLAYKKPLPEEVLQELSEREENSSSSSWRNWFGGKGKKEEKPKKEEKVDKTKKDEKATPQKKDEKADKAKKEEKTKSEEKPKQPEQKKREPQPHEPRPETPTKTPAEQLTERDDKFVEERKEHGNGVDKRKLKDAAADSEEKPPMITEKQIIRENLAQEKMMATTEGEVEEVEKAEKEKKVRRTLRPNSDMLKSLKLKPGCNTISYIVQGGSIQGEKSLTANIYLWPANSKIIISDIDGTITKSDVLGQLMPMMGRDWSQPGVASLYTNIKKNGYQLLYLTARAIGQSQTTKDFLASIVQEGNYTLPPGPVILSPDRLVPSFKREIIYRKPEVFKIACLRDLRSLFPPNHNPFYAGFGNRETDAIAYQAVGVPNGKIFTINPLGEIRLLNSTYSKSYVLINSMVNDMFPGLEVDDKYQASEEYNLVNYFKVNYDTLVDFDVSELLQ